MKNIFSSSPLHDRTDTVMIELENVNNQIGNNKTVLNNNLARPGLVVTQFTPVNISQCMFVFDSYFLYIFLGNNRLLNISTIFAQE